MMKNIARHVVTGTALGTLMALALVPMEAEAQQRVIPYLIEPAQAACQTSGIADDDGLDNDCDGIAAAATDGVDTDSDGIGNDTAAQSATGRRQHGFYVLTTEHASEAPETADDAATPARPARSRPRASIRPRD
jgi:hypothetical protein